MADKIVITVNPKLLYKHWSDWQINKELEEDQEWGSTHGGTSMAAQTTTQYVSTSTGKWKKCSDTHKPVAINCKDKTYYVQGGSCTNPGGANHIKNADIIVGLDRGMKTTEQQFPWTDGEQFLYYIQDMGVPKDIKSFKTLLIYLTGMITDGKKVFIGCIGGHGRTGLVLAALITHMTGDKDSTEYLRDTYCKKAVESGAQIKWLKKHFGINPVAPSKGGYSQSSYSNKSHNSYLPPAKTTTTLKPVPTSNGIFDLCKIE